MRISRRMTTRILYALVIWAALLPAACDSPTAPTVQTAAPAPPAVVVPTTEVPPGSPVAGLAVEKISLARAYAGYDDLVPSLRLAETSGQSAAVVISVGFNLADGAPWSQPVVWWPGSRVPAGGSTTIEPGLVYGDPEFTFSVPVGYAGRISAVVSFADYQGRRGTVTAVAALPR